MRRLLLAVPMLLGAMSIVFFAMRVLPGDPCMAMMGDQATRDALKDCVRDLGLDRPVVVQYGEFLWKSVRLDFGQSFRQHYRVSDYSLRMFPYTFTLVLASMVIALAIGLPTGILSALKRRNPLINYSVRIIALLGLSMPVFWFGILLLIMFSLRFDLFLLIGGGDMTTVLDMLTSGEFVTYPALTIRENDYIMAARALGCTPVRIMLRHILPNAISTLVVIATLDIASAIRTEAGLSFLGLGVPPPTPSWGNILSEGRQYIKCCTWLTTYSGLAIMLAVLAFNLMGDALRDLLDPRLRGE